jgi:hypothetical protein
VEPVESVHPLGRRGRTEATALFDGDFEESFKSKLILDCREVDEIMCLDAVEHSQHLVDRQFFMGVNRETGARFDRKDRNITPKVHLRPLSVVFAKQV